MKSLYILIVLSLFGLACEKVTCYDDREEDNSMKYIDLKNQEAYPGKVISLDLDSNGVVDYRLSMWGYFSIPEQAMKYDFYIASYEHSWSMFDPDEFAPALENEALISQDPLPSIEWGNVSMVNLARKLEYADGKADKWLGPWVNKQRRYLAVQLVDNNNDSVFGWIEVTMSSDSETITLHRAALSKKPGQGVIAGK